MRGAFKLFADGKEAKLGSKALTMCGCFYTHQEYSNSMHTQMAQSAVNLLAMSLDHCAVILWRADLLVLPYHIFSCPHCQVI